MPTLLLEAWRTRAQLLRDNGASGAGRVWEKAAKELEEYFNAPITPTVAEKEGLGDSETIARKLRAGKLKNLGRKHNPLVRRGDLLGAAHVAESGDSVSSIAPAIARRALQTRG